jgi:hypothetical protein
MNKLLFLLLLLPVCLAKPVENCYSVNNTNITNIINNTSEIGG